MEHFLPVSPAPALQTQPGPLRPDCDTVVAVSVLCGAVSRCYVGLLVGVMWGC